MSRLSYGQVELQLGDETLTLKPTLAALEKIDDEFKVGGLREAINKVASMKLDAVAFIVCAGAALDQKASREIKEKIFRAGLLNVVGPVSDYLVSLMNPTGRTAEEASEGGEGKR